MSEPKNHGWICLYRQLQECFLWMSNEPFDVRSAWIDLLLSCNHHDKKIMFDGKPFVITRGQYMTSIRKLSEKWGWSKDRVTRYLNVLEQENMIRRDSDSRRTVLTIVNYSVYQDLTDTNKDTDKDTGKDTDKPQYNNDNNVNKNIYAIRQKSKGYKQMMTNNICYSDYEEALLRGDK